MLGKASRDKSVILALESLAHQFDLLLIFADTKNPYAPILYKSISLSLVENFNQSQIREFILLNLIQVYNKIEDIPLNVVLEPLIRQIQVSEASQNLLLFDYQFFNYISTSNKINIKMGVLIFDILGKTYLNNIVYAPLLH